MFFWRIVFLEDWRRPLMKEKDFHRTGLLALKYVGEALRKLQDREFVSDQDIRILCLPFHADEDRNLIRYELLLDAIYEEKRHYVEHILAAGIAQLQREESSIVAYCEERDLLNRNLDLPHFHVLLKNGCDFQLETVLQL